VGPRADLDGCGESRPPPGFDPRTVQLVASRYTDCAIYMFVYASCWCFDDDNNKYNILYVVKNIKMCNIVVPRTPFGTTAPW